MVLLSLYNGPRRGCCYEPHVTEKKTEFQKGYVIGSRPTLIKWIQITSYSFIFISPLFIMNIFKYRKKNKTVNILISTAQIQQL